MATKQLSKNGASVMIEGVAFDPIERVTITPPKFQYLTLRLVGTAPYLQARFSKKAMEIIIREQQAGSTSKKGKKRDPRDFDADFTAALHQSEEGWYGIPAAAFRNASIDACRMAGYQMTRAKMSLFVQADGLDALDGVPLVKLLGDDPIQTRMAVRNTTGVVDIRARPMWREWAVEVTVMFDGDQFTTDDVVNLLARAGQQVGVGEGRPFSKNSNGMGMGLFRVANAVPSPSATEGATRYEP